MSNWDELETETTNARTQVVSIDVNRIPSVSSAPKSQNLLTVIGVITVCVLGLATVGILSGVLLTSNKSSTTKSAQDTTTIAGTTTVAAGTIATTTVATPPAATTVPITPPATTTVATTTVGTTTMATTTVATTTVTACTNLYPNVLTYSTGGVTSSYGVAVVDVNSDNKPDIITTNYDTNNVGVFLNSGNGTFPTLATYSTGSNQYPYSVAVVDINTDNKPDAIVIDSIKNTAVVLLHC